VTLDANLLVYAAQRGDRRHVPAAALLRRAVGGDCVQTLQSYAECYNVLIRTRGFEPTAARSILRYYRKMLPQLVSAVPDDLDRATQAHSAHGLHFWDAMLWATAKRAGCRMILTEDGQDGRDLEGVLLVNPFKPENTRLIDLALPLAGGARP
jgi:predicted nucleic acid-binding protein